MAESVLVDKHIEAGRRLVSFIAQRGLSLRAAFWLRPSESDQWTLILVLPEVQTLGPRAVYEQIQGVLSAHAKELDPLALEDISVIDPSDPLMQRLRLGFTGPVGPQSTFRVGHSGASTGGTYVPYRD